IHAARSLPSVPPRRSSDLARGRVGTSDHASCRARGGTCAEQRTVQSFSCFDRFIAGAAGVRSRQPHLVAALAGHAPRAAPARARLRERGPGRPRARRVGLHGGALRAAARVRRLAVPAAGAAGGAAGERQARRPAARERPLPRRVRRGPGQEPPVPGHAGRRHRGGGAGAGRSTTRVAGGRQGQLVHRRLRGPLPAHASARRQAPRRRLLRRGRQAAGRERGGRRVAHEHAALLPQEPRAGPAPRGAHAGGAPHRRGHVATLPLRQHPRVLRARQRHRPAVRRRGLRDGARVGTGGRASRPSGARPAPPGLGPLGRGRAVPQGGQILRRLLTALLALAVAAPAFAGKGDDTLNVAFERTMLTLDTYATAERLALIVAHNVGDTLIHRNPQTGEFEPHLATAWRAVDDVTFEFDLRTDVKFHNGDTFGPEDVVATFEWVIGEGAGLAGTGTLQWIESVEAVDEDTVRIKAKALTPTAYETIALIGVIYPA